MFFIFTNLNNNVNSQMWTICFWQKLFQVSLILKSKSMLKEIKKNESSLGQSKEHIQSFC